MSDSEIPGYTYGEESVAESPVTMDEFEKLQQTVMWSEEDEEHLRMAGDVLEDQIDDVLDLWYGFVGDHDAETVRKMHDAWFKSVVLQVTLWSQPYAKDGDF